MCGFTVRIMVSLVLQRVTMNQEYGLPITIARIFNCYAPRETEPYVIPEKVDLVIKMTTLTDAEASNDV